MPNSLETIKLLRHGMGFEFFMTNKILPYKSYVYIFTKGHDDAIETGKKIADWAAAGETGLPFDAATSAKKAITGPLPQQNIFSVSRNATGDIHVNFHAKGSHAIEIFNSAGALLHAEAGIAQSRHTIHCRGDSKGVHFVKVTGTRGAQIQKVIQ